VERGTYGSAPNAYVTTTLGAPDLSLQMLGGNNLELLTPKSKIKLYFDVLPGLGCAIAHQCDG